MPLAVPMALKPAVHLRQVAHLRPDPDSLLSAIAHNAGERGMLKIFLGASAGVGKTYAMLSEAHELKERGVDVIIGYAECHKRADTLALTQDLEQIPLKTIRYKNAELQELDVDAILKRQPAVVLVDELAHSNPDVCTHAKRWQDISDILDAGISVFTAINIQHIESLNDVVAQVTGVRVQETVPDSFIDSANAIELVDLPPADLQKRLEEGKVYQPERVEVALQGFFTTKNLTALRELALRKAADSVEAEFQRLRVQEGTSSTWPTRSRILVCIAPNQMGSRIVRSAARLATASHSELIALYVESPKQAARNEEDHDHALKALELAQELGFEVVRLSGNDIVGEIIHFAQRRNVTLIVAGKPIKSKVREFLVGSVVDELVRASGDIDVHVITTQPVKAERRRVFEDKPVTVRGLLFSSLGVALTTGFGLLLYPMLGPTSIALFYVLAVILASFRSSRNESAIASVVSALCFNYFFLEPRFSLTIYDPRFVVALCVMVVVALVTSSLTHRLRDQLTLSAERERRTAALYSLSRKLAQGRNKVELAKVASSEISSVFEGEVCIFLIKDGKLEVTVHSPTGFEAMPNERAVAEWVKEHAKAAGAGTDTLPGSQAIYFPLQGAEMTVGALAFKPQDKQTIQRQIQWLETFANGLGLALERAVIAKQSNEAKISAEGERLRNTLLSSISHDLRTPLTSISGAASSLVEGKGDTRDLAATILSESTRLNNQVQNLLDMTRLQTGSLHLKRTWQSPQELVGSAIEKAKQSLGSRKVEVFTKGTVGLIFADGLLIEKALVNLFENSVKATGPDGQIAVNLNTENGRLVILVSDNGKGFGQAKSGEFAQLSELCPKEGSGLGLSIVEAVVRLHGGWAFATNGASGGAIIRLELPMPEKQPEVPVD